MATASKTTAKATADKAVNKPEETEEAPNPLAGIYEGPDSFSAKFLLKLQSFITEFNGTNSRLIAADGDRDAAIKNFVETSDDEKMVALRAQLEEIKTAIRAHAEESVKTETLTDEVKASMREELKVLREKVAKGAEVARNAFEMNEVDFEAGSIAVDKLLESMPKQKRGKAKGSTGSTSPRAYCNLTVFGGNLGTDGVHFDNFSRFATKFNCEAEDVQRAFAKAGGVEWEDIKTIDRPLEFTFTPNGSDVEYTIKTTPTARPGRKPKDKTESTDSAVKAEDNSAEKTGNSAPESE